MAGLRTWLLGVILAAFAGSLARQLSPGGREQAAVRLVSGLLLLLAVLRPLADLRWEKLAAETGGFQSQVEEQTRQYRENQQEELSAIIAEKIETYIWDKADQLGLECAVTVTTAAGESGIPLPDAVTITAPYSAALSSWIEEGVGIPAEKQIWLEESTWSTMKERES